MVPDPAANSDDAELITAKEALTRYRIPPARIRQWVARKRLHPRGRRGRAHLFARGDLLAVHDAGIHSTSRPPLFPREKIRLTDNVDDREITTAEVARLYGVTPSTVRSWVARSQIAPTRKEGTSNLFRIRDLRAAEEQRCDRRWGMTLAPATPPYPTTVRPTPAPTDSSADN